MKLPRRYFLQLGMGAAALSATVAERICGRRYGAPGAKTPIARDVPFASGPQGKRYMGDVLVRYAVDWTGGR
jgi:hypothetical protein